MLWLDIVYFLWQSQGVYFQNKVSMNAIELYTL